LTKIRNSMTSESDIKENRKYINLVETARDLFWKHGFKRVTVEEICREARVSKMTYYKYFPDKIELAKTVYDMVIRKGMKKFKEIMEEDISPEEKMKKFILLKMEGTDNMSREFLKDFYDHSDNELAKYVDEKNIQAWIEAKNDFKKAQEKGMFRNNLNMDFMLYFINKVDYTDEAMLKFFNSPQEMIMEVLNLFMYGISPVRTDE
jgi:AcrR family transcriptional regulator